MTKNQLLCRLWEGGFSEMDDLLRNAFYEETDEMLQEIEGCLLEIDTQGATKEKIDSLFRYMHTIKGSSAAMEEEVASASQVMEQINLINELMKEISVSMDEQSATSEQISTAINDNAVGIEEISTSSDEIARSAEDLAESAQKLVEHVQKFKI